MAGDIDISEVVDSEVSISDSFPSAQGFATLMIVGFHVASLDRVLTFTGPDGVRETFPDGHHLRAAGLAAFANNPRPNVVKIGRRDGAPTQTLRYTPIDTTQGHVYSGSIHGVEWTYTVPAAASVASICTAIAAAIDATSLGADVDAIVTSVATSASIQTLSGATLTGALGGDDLTPPRKITVTRSSHADHDAVTAVLTGVDEFGATQSENLAFANGGNETITSTKRYLSVTSLVIPAQAGTGGTTQVGIAAAVDATDGTTHVDVAATVAGTWFAHQFGTDDGGALTSAQMTVEDRTTNPATTLETDLDTIKAADSEWIGLVTADAQSEAQIADAADWCLTNDKGYIPDSADSAVASSATTDVASDLADTENTLAMVFYHRNGGGYFPSARLWGAVLARPVGSTFALRTLTGLPTDSLTSTERAHLESKSVTYYATLGNDGRTWGDDGGGKAASGRFLDLSIYALYTNAQVQLGVLSALQTEPELPMDNGGVSQIKGAIEAKLAPGVRARKLREVVVTVPDVDDIPAEDRAARLVSGIEWDAIYIQGAHRARVRGRFAV